MADVSQIKLPNGSVYDLIDEKSGYITAEYIENKTDYEIPVSRVGEIVVGETAIGTDSTNFPTSKAVVDYVDERVVQEIDAIDVGVTGIKANGTSLSVVDGVVNIPVVGLNQPVGLITDQWMRQIWNRLNSIPTFTSQLTNDSGFITSYTETDPTVPDWAKAATKPTYTAAEVGALPSDTVITDEKLKVTSLTSNGTYFPILSEDMINTSTKLGTNSFHYIQKDNEAKLELGYSGRHAGAITFRRSYGNGGITLSGNNASSAGFFTITLPPANGTIALTTDIPTVPTNISSFTNDSGYLTASDIASVMTYKGTKANYAALPSTGNTTGDVWHLTDTGAEWAWDGSAWQELGTAIDLSNYLTISDIAAWAKASTKPTYTAAEVGALPDTTTIPSKTSDLTNDSGFITGYTETDPVFSASAAAGITATDISNWNGKIDNQYIGYLDNHNLYIPKEWTYYSGTSRFSYYVPFYVKGTNTPTISSTSKVRTIGTTTDLFSFGTIFIDNVRQSGTVTLEENKLYMYHLNDGDTKIYTVANLSDIPDVSSFLTSETDPVFSASAAAGITSTDISNWNGKSSTDEKLKTISGSSATQYYPIFGNATSTAETKRYSNNFRVTDYNSELELQIGQVSSNPTKGTIKLVSNQAQGYVLLRTVATSGKTITLPDKDGTVALTSDIPKVYSSTNTNGYLTLATLPIYDGTVE